MEAGSSNLPTPTRRRTAARARHDHPPDVKLPTLVGRKRELVLLTEDLLGDPTRDRGLGGLAVVAGDPGIGKTRLVTELADRAEAAGHRVVWGRCWDSADAPPYWPWTQVIRELVGRRTGTDLPRLVLEEPDGAGRFELFDAVTREIAAAVDRTPLLVVLDDLHRADLPSLLLTRFALHHLHDRPVAVVATLRTGELDRRPDISEQLDQLTLDATTVELTGLDVEDVAELVGDHRRAREVHALTGGNPLFIEQVLRAGGVQHPFDLDLTTTTGALLDVVMRRIRATPEATRRMLGVASVLGPPTDVRDVAALGGVDTAGVVSALAPAVEAGLAELDEVNRVDLPHALIGDAALSVLDDLLGERAVRRLHLDAARRIGDDPERIGERAHHLLRAGRDHLTTAVDVCCEAADRATAALAHEDAIVHLERALQVLDALAPDDAGLARSDLDGERLRLLLALGRARSSVSRRLDAETAFDEARRVAEQLDDPVARAEAAIGDFARYEFAGDRMVRREVLCRRALADLPDEENTLRARLLASLACTLVTGSAVEEGRRLADRAVAMARRLDDPGALAEALVAQQVTALGPSTLGRRLEGARELLALARRADLRTFQLQGRFFLMGALLERGDVRELEVELMAQRDMVARLADPRLARHTMWFQCTRALLDGRPDDAEVLAGECLAIADELGDPDGIGVFGGQLGVIRWMQDRLLEMEPVFEERRAAQPDEPLWPAVLAYVWATHDRPDAARGALEAIGDLTEVPDGLHWLLTMTTVAEAATIVDDRPRIEIARELLLPYPDRFVPAAMGAVAWGTVARPLGLAALALGHVDEGLAHLARAVDVCARLRARPWLVEAQLDLAGALVDHGRADDPRVAELVTEARATAEQLGLTRFVERADRTTVPSRPRPPRSRPTASRGLPAVSVLGTFEVITLEGEIATWTSRKARELLKILVGRRGAPVHREVIMDLLWPDVDPGELGNRVSVALSTVRRTLDPQRTLGSNDLVAADRSTIRLRTDRVEVDAERFCESAHLALEAHRTDDVGADALLQAALDVHGGEALPDEPYAEWAVALRSEVRSLHLRVVRALADRAVAAGDRLGAWDAFRRLVEVDPHAPDARQGLRAALLALDDDLAG